MVSSGAFGGTASRSWASTVATRPSKGARMVSSPTRRCELGDHQALALDLAAAVLHLEVARLAAERSPLVRLLELDLGDAHGVAAALVVDDVEQAVGAELLGPLEVAAGGVEAHPPELDGLLVRLVLLAGGEVAAGEVGLHRLEPGLLLGELRLQVRALDGREHGAGLDRLAGPDRQRDDPLRRAIQAGVVGGDDTPLGRGVPLQVAAHHGPDLHPVEVDRLIGPRPPLERGGQGRDSSAARAATTPSPILTRRESPGAFGMTWSMESVSWIMPALIGNRCAIAN